MGDYFPPSVEDAKRSHIPPYRHYVEAEKCALHAVHAKEGSPTQDFYLRLGLIHATLATAGEAFVSGAMP